MHRSVIYIQMLSFILPCFEMRQLNSLTVNFADLCLVLGWGLPPIDQMQARSVSVLHGSKKRQCCVQQFCYSFTKLWSTFCKDLNLTELQKLCPGYKDTNVSATPWWNHVTHNWRFQFKWTIPSCTNWIICYIEAVTCNSSEKSFFIFVLLG